MMAGDEDQPGEDEVLGTEELALDEDERLPWLETADDDEADLRVDTARLLGFVLVGFLVLAALIGAIWWFGNRSTDRELLAEGSTIPAPEGPYKERPQDPGGKTFEGTGNVAPAVAEGKTREGRLASAPAPKPTVDARRGSETPAKASGGVGVQVGAYSTRAAAEAGWVKLRSQTEALNGFDRRIEQGEADIGTVYRLQAVASDAAAARQLCSALKADGVACQVKR